MVCETIRRLGLCFVYDVFQNPKTWTYVFLRCCTRFVKHWPVLQRTGVQFYSRNDTHGIQEPRATKQYPPHFIYTITAPRGNSRCFLMVSVPVSIMITTQHRPTQDFTMEGVHFTGDASDNFPKSGRTRRSGGRIIYQLPSSVL